MQTDGYKEGLEFYHGYPGAGKSRVLQEFEVLRIPCHRVDIELTQNICVDLTQNICVDLTQNICGTTMQSFQEEARSLRENSMSDHAKRVAQRRRHIPAQKTYSRYKF